MKQVNLSRLIAPAQVRRAGKAEYPVLSMTMRDGLVNQTDKFKKRIASADTSPYKVVERNQLVVGFPIDEGVLAFQRLYDEAIVSPAYNVWDLRDATLINRDFLERYLRSPRALAFYKSKLRSTTARRRSLPNDMFLSLYVPLPPLGEQERIVKLLDHVDELRKLRAKADRCTANLLPALFHEMFGDGVKNPNGWPVRQLEDVVAEGKIVTYGIVQAGPHLPNGIPYIRTGDLKDGAIRIAGLLRTSPTIAASYQRSEVSVGDIVMSIRATVGTTAVVPTELNGANLTQGTARISPGKDTVTDYLLWFLRMPSVQSWIQVQVKGTTFREITLGNLRQLPVLIPPLSLQNEFARQAAEIRNLEASQTISRNLLDALFQSTLHQAFNGELTAVAQVINLQSSPEFIRAVLAAEIVDRLRGDRTFGQVKLQKVIHLIEYTIGMDEIASAPERFAAGPHDPKLIAQVETKMKDCDWYEAVPRADGYGNEYRPLAKAGGHREHFEKLWPKQAAAIRRLIDEMKTWKTERCERFATVYAAWNDLLIWGKPADDAAILDQVLNHWHTAKQQIPKTSWVETLAWMKREGYIPTGFGRATAPKPQAELFPS